MILRKWDDLPDFMKCEEVRPYYVNLSKNKASLFAKRVFDVIVSLILLIILAIPMLIIAIMIKIDSPGTVMFRQERITQYGKPFYIHKFRTMISNAESIGSSVTTNNDSRITRVGGKLRDLRLDELPQLIDVLIGDMSFVGTRPESTKYVKQYTEEMRATLLLPAGITSEASIRYKDEAKLLDSSENVDKTYLEEVLPGKMKYNLNSLKNYSFGEDILTMFRTLFAVMGKEYK